MSKGLKRICMNCGARFYDLDKSPVICPSCDTEFTGEIKVKSRRGRVSVEEVLVKAAEVKKPEADVDADDDIEDIDADDDIVSLDDVDDDDHDDHDDTTLTIDADPDDLEDDLDDINNDDELKDDK